MIYMLQYLGGSIQMASIYFEKVKKKKKKMTQHSHCGIRNRISSISGVLGHTGSIPSLAQWVKGSHVATTGAYVTTIITATAGARI